MTRNTVVDTFNGLIPQMREEGHTLQAIGETCGVSRERIRQILEKHYPDTTSAFLRERTATRLSGLPRECLRHIREKGLVNPIRRGRHWLYSRDELERAMSAYYHSCLMCGETTTRPKYCEKCVVERRRNSCKFRTLEQKERHRELVRRWQREHPEQYAVLQKKSMKAYTVREREKHFRETIYVVARCCSLPIGTRFKAIGYRKPHLLLISGIKIPVCCVRKTNDRPKTI